MAKDNFETSDVGLSAYLAALGYPRIGKRNVNGRTMFMFSLIRDRDLPNDVASYMTGENDLVSASRFQSEAMRLRDELRR